MDESLKMIKNLVSDSATGKKIDKCRQMMDGGGSFAASISETGIFSPLYAKIGRYGL